MARHEAAFWRASEGGHVRCGLCPHRCSIGEGAAGLCGVRENYGGELLATGYGRVSSVALDPIEKKPLYMFHPESWILSIGGYGCNLRCQFCQNSGISLEYMSSPEYEKWTPESATGGHGAARGPLLSPEDIASYAAKTVAEGNIGVAYTYNEPLIGYEFVADCARLVRRAGLKNVLVTNGYINREPLLALLGMIDAMNIDLKGFTDGFYSSVGGDLGTVMETIELCSKSCHVEVTTLVIPGENDGDIEGIAKWLAAIDPEIPLHLTRFLPRYRYSLKQPTPKPLIHRLHNLASKHLSNVFMGNMG